MGKLRTNLGREIDVSIITSIPYPERAFLSLLNIEISDAAILFSNHDETSHMEYDCGVLDGYTRLVSVSKEADITRVILEKE